MEISQPKRFGQVKDITYGKTSGILTPTSGFLDEYDYSLNPYSGCAFGCTYCYAAFFSRNPMRRDHWGEWIRVKENAADNLRRKLRRNHQCLDGKRIYMSSVTDPYQPIERKLGLTRAILEIIAAKTMDLDLDLWPRPKLVVQTRGLDVVRDLDLFHTIIDHGGDVQVNMTITTDDESVRRTFEPQCPSNHRRLEAIRSIASAGIPTCITLTPLLWLRNPAEFAERLIATGVRHFISQEFHFAHGRFIAMTRDPALRLMSEKLGCAESSLNYEYLRHYQMWREQLEYALGSYAFTFGEGKSGFAPLV